MTPIEHSTNLSLLKALGSDFAFVFGDYSYSDGVKFGPLSGRQMELILLRTGHVRVDCDGETFDLSAPCMALFVSTRQLEYAYGAQEVCHVAWCQSAPAGLTDQVIEVMKPYVGPMPLSEDSTALMNIGTRLNVRAGDAASALGSATAIALFEEFLLRKRAESPDEFIPKQIQALREYIEQNLEKPASMAIFSDVSGLSPQHLNKLFHKAYGENALDYLWRLRTRQGAFLLQHTGLRISQIAYGIGFKSPNHFSRLIRHRYGVSPRSFRALRWQGS